MCVDIYGCAFPPENVKGVYSTWFYQNIWKCRPNSLWEWQEMFHWDINRDMTQPKVKASPKLFLVKQAALFTKCDIIRSYLYRENNLHFNYVLIKSLARNGHLCQPVWPSVLPTTNEAKESLELWNMLSLVSAISFLILVLKNHWYYGSQAHFRRVRKRY